MQENVDCTEYSLNELAQQLTIIDRRNIINICPTELLEGGNSIGCIRLQEQFQNVKSWIVSHIEKTEEMDDIIELVQKLISVAEV